MTYGNISELADVGGRPGKSCLFFLTAGQSFLSSFRGWRTLLGGVCGVGIYSFFIHSISSVFDLA